MILWTGRSFATLGFTKEKTMKDGLHFVLGVNLIIWMGIAFYLFLLERKINRLEKKESAKTT
jgi:CcmD family protein